MHVATWASARHAVRVSAPLPTGTVTLVFTDIEGSTRLLTGLGDTYAETLAEHRRALREAFARHGGVEVDTQGDALFAAFARASDAVAAAQLAQTSKVPTRVGIHTGEPRLTEEGYVGLDVHRAARICGAAHGGQVVVSQTTRELVDVALRDLGLHRLKDFDEPVRLFQLGADQFPPLRTLSQSNLEVPRSPLVGRKKELADLLRLVRVDGVRLVTLTGPGGIGKTRLALEVAAELADAYADGVWFVDLSALRDADLVLPTIATTLGSENGVAEHIGDRRMLVVLDNLEQVAAEAAPALTELLDSCRELALVATSREPLRTTAEREYPLRPLSEAPAVELFRRRAEAVRPEFEATYEQLTEICTRVDNLPLAIELAAARSRLLAPEELLERLTERLPLLTAGARDAPERQRTLRSTIAWSYDLLSPEEQELFRRLAVFAGGWTLAAAEEVCAADLDVLASLVEKSLVRREPDRFSMLETIREFALERLAEDPEREPLRRRHAEWLVELGEGWDHALSTPEGRGLRERLAVEVDNVRVAVEWMLAAPEPQLAFRLAATDVFPVPAREVARWFDLAFELGGFVEPVLRANAYREAGGTHFVLGDFEKARAYAERSIELYSEVGDEAGELKAWRTLGDTLIAPEQTEKAERAYRRSIELAEKLSDSTALYRALHGLGELEKDRGDPERAVELLRRAVDLAHARGDVRIATNAIHGLGDAELERGNVDAARSHYREALLTSRKLGIDRVAIYCLGGLAAVAAAARNDMRAARLWGAVEVLESEIGLPLVGTSRTRHERALAGVDTSVLERGIAAGREATVQEAFEYALEDSP
jgi:predicted ATPase/class 3 adenylate cyclase